MAANRSILSLALPKDTRSLLTAAGYETLKDLANATIEGLAQDLHVSTEVAERILSLREPAGTLPSTLPTQSAAILARASRKVPTGCSSLDTLLQGGVQRGHILELSGPPGSPKELAAMSVIRQFRNLGDGLILIDCQNALDRGFLMNLSRRASNAAPPNSSDILEEFQDPGNSPPIQYRNLQTLPQFMLFIAQLPSLLENSSKNTLLAITSISFLFQVAELTPANRTAMLQKLKQSLATLTLSNKLTVLATSQLATKMLNTDGSPGTFDTGAQGIMVPQLGPTYLPSGKSWRVVFSPESQTSGVIKLLSSPQSQPGDDLLKQGYSICRT